MPINNARQIIVILLAMEVITYSSALVLLRENYKLRRRNRKLGEMTAYMANLLEKYDISLDEFDAIALTDMMREHNAATE